MLKLKKTLASLVFATALTLGAQAKLIIHRPGYGFPKYKPGPLNKQENWEAKKGWQVVKKNSQNILSYKPASDFNDFSMEENYATYHIKTEKPIKKFLVSGEYWIQKNGSIEVLISNDNKTWWEIEYFNSRNRDTYKIAWGASNYCEDHFQDLKLDKDLYIRHSVAANSNKNYLVEIIRFYASIITD